MIVIWIRPETWVVMLGLKSHHAPDGSWLWSSKRLGPIAAACKVAALAVFTLRFAFVAFLFAAPASVTASLGAVAEIALALFRVRAVGGLYRLVGVERPRVCLICRVVLGGSVMGSRIGL